MIGKSLSEAKESFDEDIDTNVFEVFTHQM